MIDALLALFDYIKSGSISNFGIIILVLLSLVQISPIKFNPYDRFFAWLRHKLLGNIEDDIKDFKEQINSVWINFNRQHILRFARECRQNVIHSLDEWHYVLKMATEYEEFCKNNDVVNGIIDVETQYIRDLYLEYSREGKFI